MSLETGGLESQAKRCELFPVVKRSSFLDQETEPLSFHQLERSPHQWSLVSGQTEETCTTLFCSIRRHRQKELETAHHNWLSLDCCLVGRRGGAPSSAHSDCWPKIALHLLQDACKIISASKETALIGVDFS